MLHADGTLLQNNILLKQLFYWKKAFHPFRTFWTQRMHSVKAEGHLFHIEEDRHFSKGVRCSPLHTAEGTNGYKSFGIFFFKE